MKTKTKIHTIIGTSQEDYDYKKDNLWVRYCANYAVNPYNMQMLLINQHLYNWFNTELVKIEKQFLQDVETYVNGNHPEELSKVWDAETKAIFGRYPAFLHNKKHTPPFKPSFN